MPDESTVSAADRTVLRAYLQRAEVRLSTMHRIAGAFLGGAGLLLLLPAFLREALVQFWAVTSNGIPILATRSSFDPFFVAVFLVLPVFIAYVIPIYALWLLLQDLTLFYFSANIAKNLSPGTVEEPVFHPRFALTAIPFCDDEAPEIKTRLRRIQFETSLKHFVLPHRKDDKEWLKELHETNDGKEVALQDDSWLAQCPNGGDRSAMRMAFGLAGAYNRKLEDEVAKSELSLIRHNLNLRRLVLRYMKALLTLVWTTLLSFVVVAALHDQSLEQKVTTVVLGFLAWSIFAPLIVRAPMRWLYREYDQNATDATNDPHLAHFERRVILGCLIAALLASCTAGYLIGWLCLLGPIIPGLALARSYGRLKSDMFMWL